MLFSQSQAPKNPIELEPLISIQLFGHKPAYQPGAMLRCDYQVDAMDRESLQAIEASVLWYTEGKGDEDLGVHYFERRSPSDCEDGDLRPLRSFSVELPNSPLSYEGEILQIHWCVRVRLFAKGGQEYTSEHEFQLAVLDREVPLDQGRIAPGVVFEEDSPSDIARVSTRIVAGKTVS